MRKVLALVLVVQILVAAVVYGIVHSVWALWVPPPTVPVHYERSVGGYKKGYKLMGVMTE